MCNEEETLCNCCNYKKCDWTSSSYVHANMPVCYSQTGLFDIVTCRGETLCSNCNMTTIMGQLVCATELTPIGLTCVYYEKIWCHG